MNANQIFYNIYNNSPNPSCGERKRLVVIGKFDGVHTGHKMLIEQAVQIAKSKNLQPCALTFSCGSFIYQKSQKEFLTSDSQKTQLLFDLGLETVFSFDFNHSFSTMSAREFIQNILFSILRAGCVVVGMDFRFGKNAQYDVKTMQIICNEFDIACEVVRDVCMTEGEGRIEGAVSCVSSSLIRQKIKIGDIESANRMLGRLHAVRGVVRHGAKRGRLLGFPTANLQNESIEGMPPRDGVYAGWMRDGSCIYPAAISIGTNPTFAGSERSVEAHALDVILDLYHKSITIEFVQLVRSVEMFESVALLIEQMHLDLLFVKRILNL